MLSNLKTFMMLMAYWKLGPWRTGNATSLEILGTGFSPCGALHGASSANFDAFPDFLFAAMIYEVHLYEFGSKIYAPTKSTATPLLQIHHSQFTLETTPAPTRKYFQFSSP